jgi:hypothetical protein
MGAPLVANAAIVSGFGVAASSVTASNCPSFCTTGGGGDFQYDSAGGEFITVASSTETSYASGEAFADLAGSTYLPTLRVRTSADVGRGGDAEAFGVQGFTYTGPGATTLILDFNLHGSVGEGTPGAYSYNVLRADVAVMIGSQLDWYPDFATLVYEVATGNVVGNESVFISTGNDVDVGSSISFAIDPGTDFYVIASMGANSRNGFADSWNTLSLSFDDDTGLTAASVVPVPAAVWLFGSALAALGCVRRNRTSA